MDEAQILQALFGDDEEFDLDAGIVRALAESEAASPLVSDAEVEKQMREHLGLSRLDVSTTLSSSPMAGTATVRPSDGDREDYNEYEWEIVIAMRRNCMLAIRPETSQKARHVALRWLFVRGTEDKKGISFHLACEALEARYWVIQALVQHYFAVRDIPLTEGLPDQADGLPEALQSEAMFHAWLPGVQLAEALWSRPGILESELEAVCGLSSDDYSKAMTQLVDCGLVSMRVSRAYFAARPAAIRNAGNGLSWSRSFLGE